MNVRSIQKKYVGKLAFVRGEISGFKLPADFVTFSDGDVLLFTGIKKDKNSPSWMTVQVLSKFGLVFLGCNSVMLKLVFKYV